MRQRDDMTRYGTLLGQHGKPKERVIIMHKGSKTTRVKFPHKDRPGFNLEEVKVDASTVLDDGGELWEKYQRTPNSATFVSFSGEPQGHLHVQRVYKNVIKASVYEGNGQWGRIDDFHPKQVLFDAGEAWPTSKTDQLLNDTDVVPAPEETPTPTPKTTDLGQRVGYVRVSSTDQNLARQREAIGAVDREFVDELSARSRAQRPGLEECISYLRNHDELVVASIDRLARSLVDLRTIIDQITEKGAAVRFIKEGLVFSATDQDPRATLMLGILGSFAEFERSIIRERQAEGIALAKKAGKYSGRKKALSPAQVKQARDRIDAGESKTAVAQDLGVGRATLYRYLMADNKR